jgi:hypothetical protein
MTLASITAGAAFAAMRAYRQFILYQLAPRPDGRTDKFPVNPHTGRVDASAHDPAIWMDADTAAALAVRYGPSYGVGFVFTEADPFFFIDIDGALQPDGQWSPIAQWMVERFPGACVEVSQSGRGLHIIGSGRPVEHRSKNAEYHLEYYTALRFVALTGIHAAGDSGSDHTAALHFITDQLFKPVAGDNGAPLEWTTAPCSEWNGPADDGELLRRACLRRATAGSAFGIKATFADLFEANPDALARAFPHAEQPFDASSADAALAAHLMFWTGRNCERVERLMRLSALARPKWDERSDYLRDRTIMNAMRISRDVLQDKPLDPPPGAVMPAPGVDAPAVHIVTGPTFLNPAQQIDLFKGCVYVADIHRVMVPGGKQYRPEQFRAHFGGYAFSMDAANERTSRNAWEAFTESQVFRPPRADSVAFKPNEQPGILITKGGQTLVNTYWPVDVPRMKGDPAPFLAHVAKLLPDARDQQILIAYIAACVQHQGYKFQWAPLLQGVQGNGKTLISRCVAEAIGARYVHWPKASKLSNQFNGWMVGKTFYAVEDIFTPQNREEILEDLKPMITGGDGLEIEGKGVDQISVDICGNFIFNCNKRAGLRKTKDDRRYCTLFTPQQSKADLGACGMTGDYFPKLYRWLKLEGGYAIVTDFLMSYAIPAELNPALECGGLAHIAPETSTTHEAIRAGVGRVEQELAEAISAGRPGFRGGWISFTMFGALLKEINLAGRLSPNMRREILQDAGYDYHPGLPDGRCTVNVIPDGDKPRLFTLREHPMNGLRDATVIAETYAKAQQP